MIAKTLPNVYYQKKRVKKEFLVTNSLSFSGSQIKNTEGIEKSSPDNQIKNSNLYNLEVLTDDIDKALRQIGPALFRPNFIWS